MKRYIATALLLLLALSLCACGKSSAPAVPSAETTLTESTPAPTETPTLPAVKVTVSAMSGSIAADSTGKFWTNLAELEAMGYAADLLPEETGYVYGFLIAGDMLYAAVKDSLSSMDGTRLYEVPITGGEPRLLAENGSGACVFCLLGDNILLYPAETGGMWAIDLTTGTVFEALPEAISLITARDGLVYYTRADNSLCRNDSTGLSEEKLLDNCPSYWLAAGEDGFCCLAYADDDTALLEFRNADGSLKTRLPLTERPAGLYSDGTRVYIPHPSGGSIAVYDIATGEPLDSIPLGEHEDVLLLYADSGHIFYHASDGGVFSLWGMKADGSEATLLAENIY